MRYGRRSLTTEQLAAGAAVTLVGCNRIVAGSKSAHANARWGPGSKLLKGLATAIFAYVHFLVN